MQSGTPVKSVKITLKIFAVRWYHWWFRLNENTLESTQNFNNITNDNYLGLSCVSKSLEIWKVSYGGRPSIQNWVQFKKKLLLYYYLLDLLHSNAWCIASRDLLCFQFSLRYNSPTSKVNWEPKLCVQHLQLTLEYYNFLLNWTPNFFQAILRKIIFRLRHSLI